MDDVSATAQHVPPPAAETGTSDPAAPQSAAPAHQGWIRRIWSACWKHRGVTLLAAVAALGGIGLGALTPLLTKIVIDDATSGNTDGLGWVIGALIALAVIRFGSSFLRRWAGGKLSLNVQHDLRQDLFAAMQRLDGASQDKLRTGQLISRANTDLQLVQGLLAMVPLSAGQAILFVISLGIMLVLSPLLTLIALAVIPLVIAITRATRTKLFPATWAAQQSAAEVAEIVEEDVTGVRVVKGFGQEARETRRLEVAARSLYSQRLRAVRLTATFTPALSAVTALGQVGVLALGGYLAWSGSISIGTFVAFSAYLAQIVGPTRTLAMLLVMGQQARAGVERVFEVIDSRSAVVDPADPQPVPDGPIGVRLTGVDFGYLAEEPVLRGFDLEVRPGETVALVGPSGSGKSTISLLLPRFYDVQSGAVEVGGVDVRQLGMNDLRHTIGVVFEEAFLFSDSISANIAYGQPGASAAQIHAAAVAAEADTFIRRLPDGYDTVIGERGLTLSGGQRQRIALARALLAGPRVLILDDATSAVDPATEAAIHDTLAAVTADRTTILIAHRRSTLDLADRIAVVDGGRVVAVGTHEELLAGNDLYAELIDQAAARPVAEPAADGITPALWEHEDSTPVDRSARIAAARSEQIGPRGAGGRGGGHMGGFLGAVSATPELMSQVAALPPATDLPPPARETEPEDEGAPFRFWKVIRSVRPLMVIALALVAVDAGLGLAMPLLVKVGVDGGVQQGTLSVIWWTSGAALAVAAVDLIVQKVQMVAAGRAGETVLYTLRVRSFAHLQRLGLDYYEGQMTGRIMTRMTTDVDALSSFLQTGLITSVVSLFTFAGIAIVLVVMDFSLALLALATLPVLIIATVIFRRFSYQAYSQAREKVAIVNADLAENVAGLRVTQSVGRDNAGAFAARSDDYRRSRMRAQTAISIYFPFVALLSELAAALVLGVGAGRVVGGTLSVGTLLAFVLYLDSFFSPIQQLSQAFDGYQQARIGLTRIGQLLATPVSTPEAVDPLPVGRLTGRVSAEHAVFRYPDTEIPAVDDVSLTIAPGETVAVVGATGAGKSTLVKLIARFYDVSSGAIAVDGRDIRTLDLQQFRQRLGVVPQEAHLFAGSIRDNIAYGRPDASPAEVEHAARSVGALPVIARFPGGFGHQVSDRGRNLSAGQRQLIALARAELVDPDLLLLDEATAALDPAAEAAVLDATDRLAKGRTTVVVAHRLTTAARADRIIVMSDGRIAESGRHKDLISAGGAYAALYGSAVSPASGKDGPVTVAEGPAVPL
ncbi:ABC transporter ATP-binding protein [Nakamurella silvestris]|nr:ABC transporter ATP-binding protein [Nakamurella silvestris]